MPGAFSIIAELIQRNLALSTVFGFVSLSGLIALYEKLKPKSSNVHIRQRYETGAAIRQPNRIDIDLFLYAENRGELTGTLEFCTLTEEITFRGPDGSIMGDPSELGRKRAQITSPPSADQALSSDEGSPVTLRFTFPEDGQLSELLLQYEEMEIPWGVRVAEGKREYTVTGTAIVKHPSGGARFPPPD